MVYPSKVQTFVFDATGQIGDVGQDLGVDGLCIVSWTAWTEVTDMLLFPTLSAHLDFVSETGAPITLDETFKVLPLGQDTSVGSQFICQHKSGETITFRLTEDTPSLTAEYGWRVTVQSF